MFEKYGRMTGESRKKETQRGQEEANYTVCMISGILLQV